MMAHAEKDHGFFQPRETNEAIRNKGPAHAIDVDGFHLGKKEPAKNTNLGIRRGRLVELR